MAVILEDFLSEEEALSMPEETLEAYVKIFSQELFRELIKYMESPDSNKEVVDRLQDVVGTVITRSTFHNKVNERGLKTTMYENQLKTLPFKVYSGEIDVDTFIEDLNWLDKNTHNLSSTLPLRTKEMYQSALSKIKAYEADTTMPHQNKIYEQLVMYKDLLFFPKKNKPVETGMRSITLNKNRWKMQLRAAEYLSHCYKNGIALEIAREI